MNGDATTPAVRLGVDVGGTFTDVALLVDDALTTAKVPTTEPQSDGVIEGIREACADAGIAPADVDAFAHAMTVSVNALLERDGARTALVTTAGFRDVLEIGRQDRPSLYDLGAEKPEPLVPRRRRFEVDERATVDGIRDPVDEEEIRELAERIDAGDDVESVAVSLLHAYAHPGNEARVAEGLRDALDVPVSASHEVRQEFREFERTATTVADAYVTPGIDGYLSRLLAEAREAGLPDPRVMRSNGGVADVETVRSSAVTTVLSGPAAGVVGAAAVASGGTLGGPGNCPPGSDEREAGAADGVVTFDMGGTSSDVSLVRDGTAERTDSLEIGGVPVRTPAVDIETVGAGGGSIAWTDAGGALRVGPESAGADPGPACYGRGGTEPTVTDAAVVLGYIGPDAALGGDLSLDVEAARESLAALSDAAGLADATAAAKGVYRVANATMARAIRSVTVERGHDPRGFALVAFGGAGPMHAAALADRLGISRVLVPGPAGVLSAYGLLAADETHDAVRTVRVPLTDDGVDGSNGDAVDAVSTAEESFRDLTERVLADVSDPAAATVERSVDCRYAGQRFELTVPAGEGTDPEFDPEAVTERFVDAHERAYGYRLNADVEAVTLRVSATVGNDPPPIAHAGATDAGATDRETRAVTFPETGTVEAGVLDRDALAVGRELAGPAVLAGAESTTVVPPEWAGRVRADGTVVLTTEVSGS
ncbi:N-methylhydantoinase A [Halorubrum alkaliphilum]|uniref:N-methylhydantoinase A n=1 Tax=Halorubrum alkaliphilum TaxID=261290 RepID=A0A8T4GK56_9EURY|nr:hydantoinase/oxoprolinase family protein [Halorubrum alkaliphilum]MBP1923395.1 N-methylhydantoinase A [Halorubrum alkaliphilum]